MNNQKYVVVPVEPSEELLNSMAIRSDHGLAIPGYYDAPLLAMPGITHEMRFNSTVSSMRQLHEEVVGTGFYQTQISDEVIINNSSEDPQDRLIKLIKSTESSLSNKENVFDVLYEFALKVLQLEKTQEISNTDPNQFVFCKCAEEQQALCKDKNICVKVKAAGGTAQV